MAGDWIKLEHATPNKPEIYHLARLLGISRGDAFLLAAEWWIWLDQNTRDGNVTLLLRSDVDVLMHCPGFSAAMEAVGWQKFSVDNSLMTPHFDRHNGKTAKNRALTKDRMKRLRDANVTQKTSPEKRREDITTTPYPTPELSTGQTGTRSSIAGDAPAPPSGKKANQAKPRVNGTNPRALGANPRITDAAANPDLPRGNWWASEAATLAAANTLGLGNAKGGESWDEYRGRIRAEIAARKRH